MRNRAVTICTIMTCALVMQGSLIAFAGDQTETFPEGKRIRRLPSEALVTGIAGKTLDVRLSGYGWGDGADSLNLDFTVTEPLCYSAAEIESLSTGDVIDAVLDSYTVKSVEKEDDVIIIVPEEEWLTPVTFTINENGSYYAENGDGIVQMDILSFPCLISPNLIYVNDQGESLKAEDLIKELEEGTIDVDNALPKASFDEEGYLVELNLSM